MYSTKPGLILAFHGCDQSVVEKVLLGKAMLKPSMNEYDWLGNGIYFWENDPKRALEYATQIKNSPRTQSSSKISIPAVIGAVINLGFCLDLLEYGNLQLVKLAYSYLEKTYINSGRRLPENIRPLGANDVLRRNLDCASIEALHKIRKDTGLKPFDSVRGVFWEGKEIFPTSGFREKDHIQISIRNPNCIKGFFLPRDLETEYSKV
ncbi:MAG TPA: hypothetical protein VK470_19480 [Bacteroidota bacterium]|nr:hypothetical protein [Bacteroidota bacterium]